MPRCPERLGFNAISYLRCERLAVTRTGAGPEDGAGGPTGTTRTGATSHQNPRQAMSYPLGPHGVGVRLRAASGACAGMSLNPRAAVRSERKTLDGQANPAGDPVERRFRRGARSTRAGPCPSTHAGGRRRPSR